MTRNNILELCRPLVEKPRTYQCTINQFLEKEYLHNFYLDGDLKGTAVKREGTPERYEPPLCRHEPPLCRHEPPIFARQTEPPLWRNEHAQYIKMCIVQCRRFFKTWVLSLNKRFFGTFRHSGMRGFSKMRSIYQLS